MNFTTFCIHRPAFTIVISLVMMIIGVISFMNLPLRWVPNVNPPVVNVVTVYPGANAAAVEHDITKLIEDSLSGISGIDNLSSVTRRDESQITLTFKLGRNMDAAVEEVRAAVEKVHDQLPKDAKNPVVYKADPNGQAILYLSFADTKRDARELSDYVDQYLVPAFETLEGVGQVQILGKRVTAMQIRLDPAKMAGANVTSEEIAELLQAQNTSIPSGQIRAADRFYNVITDTSLKSAEQFNDLIIRNHDGQLVRLKDVGEAKLDVEDSDTIFRINGVSGIALGIIAQSTANPLEVEKSVQKTLAKLKPSLPAGLQADIVFNQADYIRSSIQSVYEALFEAIIFVWLVILIFLGNFRASFVPIITIPVCLISSFALLYFLGFSINTITLMAFVLAIGLVVDDAIVMLENISRHVEAGMTPFKAAVCGSREMIFPVIAMTLTLTAVYAPIAFTPGLLGVLFREFTFTLAGAVLISGVVALTLSPMMCAYLLKNPSSTTLGWQAWVNERCKQLQNKYQIYLSTLLKKRSLILAILCGIVLLGIGLYTWLPVELAPDEDMGQIYVVVSAPHGASTSYTDSYVRQLEPIYKQSPEIQSYISMMFSPSHVFQIISLKPKQARKRSTEEMVAFLNAQLAMISGVKINVFMPAPPLLEFSGDEGDRLGVSIMTTRDYRKLQESSQSLLEALKKHPKFTHAENTLKWDTVQFQVNIDRERAADLKVPITTIARTLSTLLAGRQVGKMDEANILIQLKQTALANPNIFQELYVRNENDKMLPLASMLNVEEVTSPVVYRRAERLRADNIYLSLAPKVTISEAITILEKLAKEHLSDDMKYSFTGQAKSFLDSNGSTIFSVCMALLFIYLVLVAQFESFIDPLTMMLTVPFAVVGAMLTLKVFGGSLNIYSNIGVITLIGLIAKHGILMTDVANHFRRQGKSVEEAILAAATLRLRPILMTTAAMVLGALPLAFAMGAGAESRQQIGLVITGGLIFGTFFSLVVVPVMYTYLSPFRNFSTTEMTETIKKGAV